MRVPKYRRNPDGRAFVEYRKHRTYLGKFGTVESQKAYASFIEKLSESDEPPSVAGLPTINIIAQKFLKWADAHYPQRHGQTEVKTIELSLRPLIAKYGELRADKFGPLKLADVQAMMVKRKLARTTINVRIWRIRKMFRWAAAHELIPPAVYHGLLAVQGVKIGTPGVKPERKVRAVPRKDVEALLPFLSRHVRAMVQVQLSCGMRPSEVCVMRPCDIDRSGKIWIYRPASHKGAHLGLSLAKAIPPHAQEILLPFMEGKGPTEYIFNPMDAKRERWPTSKRLKKTRDHFHPANYYRRVSHAFKKAEKAKVSVPYWHVHQLRHLSATEVRRLLGEEAAQVWLGHSNLSTTAIYTEKDERELLAVAEQISRRQASQSGERRGRTPARKQKPKRPGRRTPRR